MVEKFISSASESAAAERKRERLEVSHEPFGRHFLGQIVRHVAAESLAVAVVALIVPRQVAAIQHASEFEVGAELFRYESAEFMPERSAAQQIGMATTELPGARATERKLHTSVFDECVDLVEQRRDLLHFVDDHELRRWLRVEFLAQQRRALQVSEVLIRAQQIDSSSVGIDGF